MNLLKINFTGTLARLPYFYSWLISGAIICITVFGGLFITEVVELLGIAIMIAGCIYGLLLFISATKRRFNDLGWSNALFIGYYVLLLGTRVIGLQEDAGPTALILSLPSFIWSLVVFFKKGKSAPADAAAPTAI